MKRKEFVVTDAMRAAARAFIIAALEVNEGVVGMDGMTVCMRELPKMADEGILVGSWSDGFRKA